jgi:hypothetical protein
LTPLFSNFSISLRAFQECILVSFVSDLSSRPKYASKVVRQPFDSRDAGGQFRKQ